MDPFLQGGITAIVGAVFGYLSAIAKEARERRLRKAAVATALLTELRWQERVVRQLAELDDAALSRMPLLTHVHDLYSPHFILFQPRTGHSLFELRGFIRDMERQREELSQSGATPDAGSHGFFRVKAQCAAEVIPILRQQLEAEGGIVEPEIPRAQTARGGKTNLPPPAFPASS